MKIYLVGGAVRDILMNLKPKDRDYVVVGATESEMLALGYEKVGAHFPVYLNPETNEEYALARKEVKTKAGYHGFDVVTQNVTLEEDLYRRDLTINSMAMDSNSNIIDPYGGQSDIKSKTLRHVSPHFSEDPLRVLRVARFASRYNDFSIASETKDLMKDLVQKEGKSLVSERVYAEFEKAFFEYKSEIFFKELQEVGFFSVYFGIEDNIELHENWNLLSTNQKWAYLASKYKKFEKLTLSNFEKKISQFYNVFLKNNIEYSFENSWSFIRQLRLLNHADMILSELEPLLSLDQNKFLNFLVEISREFNSVDKESFEKDKFFERLESEKRKAWSKIFKAYGN